MDWLNELKFGDEVAICNTRGWGRHYTFAKVEKISKLHFTVDSKKFRRSSGYEAGTSYGCFLEQATPELKAEVADKKRRVELLREIDGLKWRNLSTEQLEMIVGLFAKSE